jgi:exosortase
LPKSLISMKIEEYINRRNILFLLSCALSSLVAYTSIRDLYDSSGHGEYYSHIVLIPLISIYLIYQKRKFIFSEQRYCFNVGIPLLLVSVLLYFFGQILEDQLNKNDFSSIIALSAVVSINGVFILLYSIQAFKKAIFPLLFLIFIIPIPSTLMDSIIYFLQVGSVEFTKVLFMATGVPFLKEGFVFNLPGMSVEVAKQCSGIRSGLALFIIALLAGHLFLNSWWKKIILIVAAIPIAMFKNGIRIVTLTLLGTYVDPRILQSSLHKEGGIPFFILALLFIAPVLYFLRKSEKKNPRHNG